MKCIPTFESACLWLVSSNSFPVGRAGRPPHVSFSLKGSSQPNNARRWVLIALSTALQNFLTRQILFAATIIRGDLTFEFTADPLRAFLVHHGAELYLKKNYLADRLFS